MTMLSKAIFLLLPLLAFESCSKAKKTQRPPPTVSVATVEQREVPLYIDAIGQAIPPVTVQVRTQVAGKLLATYIQQGADVKFGELLYTIDPRPYEDALREAEAQLIHDQALLTYAERTVERYKSVLEDDFIAKLTFEQYVSTAESAKAQVELDKAAVEAAKLNVEFCSVVAPVSGKISSYNVDVGNILVANDPTAITTIRPNAPIDISFSLPQKYFEMIRAEWGLEKPWNYVATLPENPKETYEGETYFIDNQVNQDTGTILLKGRLSNLKQQLWPGEFVRVQVLHKKVPNALVVPPGAVLMGKNGPYVYSISKEKKAEAHNVTVLSRMDTYVAFESKELAAGDIVVVEGQINIAPGTTVGTVVESK